MINLIVKGFPIVVIFIAWFYTYYQGVTTAISVWTASEIFNHCFLVIPGAFFLIYQKRRLLFQQSFVANYWLLVPLMGTLVLYTFGYVGDIRLFMHIATFVSLPLLIWLVIGNQAAKIIKFPLYFMLFAIPVGEQLIPYLQELTTDLAVPLLEMTGVPIYRNGLYLDIPEGRFLVAEACSGISFLVASIVFGNLYAYLSFKTLTKQLSFVLISLVVPIIANALRVYGIVLTAHLTDMEYAAGADHLIYGGVFYAIILFLLIMIGEKFRDKTDTTEPAVSEISLRVSTKTQLWFPSLFIAALFLLQYAWISNIEKPNTSVVAHPQSLNLQQLPFVVIQEKLRQWQPHFPDADVIQQGHVQGANGQNIDFFIASYNGGKGELISSQNKLYNADRWTLVNRKVIALTGSNTDVYLTKLAAPAGDNRYIIHWYQLGKEKFTSDIKAKLYRTTHLLLGRADNNGLIAFSMQFVGDGANAAHGLQRFIATNFEAIDKILPSNDDA
ncbi:MAG: EpsI family protein [Colwellia sp.]|nr:EpsI family protein [Colwellia sp.]